MVLSVSSVLGCLEPHRSFQAVPFALIEIEEEWVSVSFVALNGVKTTGRCLKPNSACPANSSPGWPGSRRNSGSCSSIMGSAIEASKRDSGAPTQK